MTGPLRAAVALVVVVLALFALRQVDSPDIGFHLKAGNQILSGQGWPQTDPFTYTVTDHPYIDTSWGYQVVIASVERLAGAPGLILLHVALTLVLFTLVTLTARLVPGEVRVLLPLLLLGGLAAEPRFEVRPEMWSYTLLAFVLYLLHRHAERRRSPLWLLPVVFLVWTNSHSLFVLGWAALACFVLGLWLRDRQVDRPLLGWAAASIVVGLLNPYGWRALVFPFELATRMRQQNIFARNIGEFFSPLEYLRSDQLMFYLASIVCFFVFAMLAILSVLSLWRQRRFWCVLLCVVFLPLALTMIRNIPPLIVVCLPGCVFGLSLSGLFDRLGLQGSLRRRLSHVFLGGLLLVVAGLGVRVCTDACYVSNRRLERFGLGWNELTLPVAAAEFAGRSGLDGHVLNHLNFGAYLMWALDRPVFIDGRLEVMGEAFYEEYRRALDSPAGLEAAVRRYDIEWIVFPYRLRPDLLNGLSRAAGWRAVYVDHLAAVFVRRDVAVAADESVHRMQRTERPQVDIASLPGLGGPARPGSWSGWLAGFFEPQEYPSAPFNRGILHFHREEPLKAAQAFAEAIRLSEGRYYEIYNNLGAALYAAGRLPEARECFLVYLAELPYHRRGPRRRARQRLAEIEGKLGN